MIWHLHSVSEPRGEERSCNTDEVVEDRDSHSQHKGDTAHEGDEEDPGGPSHDSMIVKMSRVSEDSDEDDLRGCVDVERASNEQVGQGDAVCGL